MEDDEWIEETGPKYERGTINSADATKKPTIVLDGPGLSPAARIALMQAADGAAVTLCRQALKDIEEGLSGTCPALAEVRVRLRRGRSG